MKVRVAAYKLLLEVAHADGRLSRAEFVDLKHYEEALEIDPDELQRETHTPVTARVLEGGPEEAEEAVRAMLRVGLADGELHRAERRRIRAVARRLGVGPLRFANLVHRERRAHGGRGRPARPVIVVAVLLILGVAAVRHAGRSRAAEVDLTRQAQELEGCVVLLETRYDMVKDGRVPVSDRVFGTAFFVDEAGHLVTNKHVVEPWKFQPEAVELASEGYLPDGVVVTAWLCGTPLDGAPRGDWSSSRGDLTLVRTADDHLVTATRRTGDGRRVRGTYHALDEHDLALLKVDADPRCRPAPLAPGSDVAPPATPIIVLGFPRGPHAFERGLVVCSALVGYVAKVEDTLSLRAPIEPGNSGGPVVDREGRVVAVAAKRYAGPEGHARCVRVDEVHALLRGR